MHREERVEDIRRDEMIIRHRELHPHGKRLQPSDDEEYQRREHVEDADPLVVHGGEPRELVMRALVGAQHSLDHCFCGFVDHFKLSRYAVKPASCSGVNSKFGIRTPGFTSCGFRSQRIRLSCE